MLKLNNLSPSEGARKNKKRVGRGPGSGTGKTAAVDIKVRVLELAIAQNPVLKVARCLCIADCLKEVLPTFLNVKPS